MPRDQARPRLLLIQHTPDARLSRPPRFDVESVSTLAAGVRRLAGEGIDVVLVDLDLPDSRGLETFVRVRAAAGSIPVVVRTGIGHDGAGVHALAEGAQDHFLKGREPPATLSRRLHHAIARQHAGQHLEALVEVGHELATLDMARAADHIVSTVLGVFRAHRACLFRLDAAPEILRCVAAAGAGQPGIWIGATLQPGEAISGLVLTRRQAVWSSDFLNDTRFTLTPALRRLATEDGAGSVIGVPLSAGGEVLGVLALTDQPGRVFTDQEVRLLSAFADQAALALGNARLFEEAERRRREAEELAAITHTLTQTFDVAAVADRVVQSVRSLFGTHYARVSLLQPDMSMQTAAWVGSPGTAASLDRLDPGQGIRGWAVREGRAVTVPDFLAEPRIEYPPGVRAALAASDYRAALAVPLRVKAETIGALVIGDRIGRVFSHAEAALLQTFADQVALVLENARLYAETVRRGREAALVAELTETINASLDADTTLRKVVGAARELCGADVARIALREPRSETIAFRHWVGTRYEGYAHVRLSLDAGLTGEVIRTGRPTRTACLEEDPRILPAHLPAIRAEGSVTAMIVPIRIADQVEGVLGVDNRSTRPFTDRDEATLMRLAHVAAAAILNKQLLKGEAEARVEAEASETRYRTLFDGVPVGLIRTMPEGQIVDANQAAATLLGYEDREALLAAPAIDVYVDPEDRARFRAVIDRDGFVRDYEVQLRRRDGTPVWVRNNSNVGRDAQGRPVYEGAIEDITDLKRAGDEARKLEDQLRQGQKMEAVGRLAGGIAHDFNNLLTIIIGRSQLLMARLRPDDPVRRDIDVIQKTASRTAALTKQLLAFSRKQVLELKVLDLNAVVENMSALLHRLIGEDIELQFVPGARHPHVRADDSQLEQVIANLTINARDAMPNGGRLRLATANVELAGAGVRALPVRAGAYVVLTVTDSGTGMDEQTRGRIFEPFFTTKEVGQGTGLGLSTVYGIVTQSGGHVAVESAVGVGTTFDIYLPAAAPEAERAEPGDSPDVQAGGTETVLLVEDEDEVRRLAREILQTRGYAVLEARDPREAILIAGRHAGAIDLLLTDVVMPRMSGRALAEQLAPLRPAMKVLYMSGYTDNAMVRHGVMDDGLPLLPKPFHPDALAARVRTLLDHRAAR